MNHSMYRTARDARVSHGSFVRPPIAGLGITRHSASIAAAALVLGTARVCGGAEERANEAFLSAVRLYEDCHWEFAFERFASLADQGHVPAAKLVLLMLRYGSPLYGTNFTAKPEQVARWAQRVLRATPLPTASPNAITASA
ncbi:MAG: hypothetical protein H7X75_11295 [Burkholderiaceae bacterium]|nr:hypothetical protein [Burkholderiaceae bacterium]